MTERTWTINNVKTSVRFATQSRLTDVLRNDLGLTGGKQNCGQGECGACSVLVNDRLLLGCLTLAATLPDHTEILTVEGLANHPIGQPLQAAFVKADIVQCGYCMPGMLAAATALLLQTPDPTEQQIKWGISGNLCRCNAYSGIVAAISTSTGALRNESETRR